MGGNFYKTLKNIYKNTQCAVKIGTKLTQYFPCKQGVRQGDPLSPNLFNLYINGIFSELKQARCDPVSLNEVDNINALAYADDIILLSTSKEGLQKALDTTEKYFKKWKLEVNHKKRNACHSPKAHKKRKQKFENLA